MISQQLIQQYEEKRKAEQAASEEYADTLSNKLVEVVEAQMKTWFGDFLSELSSGGKIVCVEGSINSGEFKIQKPVIWMGKLGHITMYVAKRIYKNRTSEIAFHFDSESFSGQGYISSERYRLTLPNSEEFAFFEDWKIQKADPIPAERLGELLQSVKTHIEKIEVSRAAGEKHYKEYKLRDFKNVIMNLRTDNGNLYSEEYFRKTFYEAVQMFPEMKEVFSNQYLKFMEEHRKERVLQDEIKKQAEEKFIREEKARQELLEQVKSIFDQPVVLFKIKYGAKAIKEYSEESESEEVSYYTESDLFIDYLADKDGFFTKIHRGELQRIKLYNLISVEEVIIRDESEVPNDYYNQHLPFTRVELTHETEKEVTVGHWYIPLEVKRLNKEQK
jgi:hypothetical protein